MVDGADIVNSYLVLDLGIAFDRVAPICNMVNSRLVEKG